MAEAQKAKPPTQKQRLAAKAVSENLLADKPKNLGVILADIGYSPGITKTPSMVVESAGFKQALYDLGLTEDLITSSLVDDIRDKPKNRLGELKLGAELLQMVKKDEPEAPKNVGATYNFLFTSETKADVAAIESRIVERLTQQHDIPTP